MSDNLSKGLATDNSIIVEFPPKPGVAPVSRPTAEDIIRKSNEAVEKAMATIQEMARHVTTTIDKISDPPTQMEVEFGIKFDSEVGAVVAKAGMECSINVKLTWERKR